MFLVCFSIKTLVSLALGSSMENLASPSSPGTPPSLLGSIEFRQFWHLSAIEVCDESDFNIKYKAKAIYKQLQRECPKAPIHRSRRICLGHQSSDVDTKMLFSYMQVKKLCFPKYTWPRDIMHQQAKIKKQSKGFFSRSIALSLCHLSLRGNQVIGSAFLVFLCFLLKNLKKLSMSYLTLSNSAMIVGSPVPPPSHPPWKWKIGVLISDKWPQMFTYQRKAAGHQRETSFQTKSSNFKS